MCTFNKLHFAVIDAFGEGLTSNPKDEGGLGVLNLRTQNEALLLKFLRSSTTKRVSLGST
jgi:hypothetical protein